MDKEEADHLIGIFDDESGKKTNKLKINYEPIPKHIQVVVYAYIGRWYRRKKKERMKLNMGI